MAPVDPLELAPTHAVPPNASRPVAPPPLFANRPVRRPRRRVSWKQAAVVVAAFILLVAAVAWLGNALPLVPRDASISGSTTPARGRAQPPALSSPSESPGSERNPNGSNSRKPVAGVRQRSPVTDRSERELHALPDVGPGTAAQSATAATLTRADASRVVNHLRRARDLLGENRFAEAHQEVTSARGLVSQPDHVLLVDGWDDLVHYVHEYWRGYGDGLSQLRAGADLKIGSATVHVVSRTETELVLRVAGENRRYLMADLPAGLVRHLAESWLTPDATSTHLILGAVRAVGADASRDEAERQWAAAARQGADVRHLQRAIDSELSVEELLK